VIDLTASFKAVDPLAREVQQPKGYGSSQQRFVGVSSAEPLALRSVACLL
jgi:hypothetical protein